MPHSLFESLLASVLLVASKVNHTYYCSEAAEKKKYYSSSLQKTLTSFKYIVENECSKFCIGSLKDLLMEISLEVLWLSAAPNIDEIPQLGLVTPPVQTLCIFQNYSGAVNIALN